MSIKSTLLLILNTTVNVDIFACINFREFAVKGNFACIKIRGFPRYVSLIEYCINIHAVHIFAHFSFPRKYVQREIIYIYSICSAFTL